MISLITIQKSENFENIILFFTLFLRYFPWIIGLGKSTKVMQRRCLLLILWNGGIPCIQILHTKDGWSTLKIECIVIFLSPFRKLFTYKQLFNRPPLPPLNIPFPSKSRNMGGGGQQSRSSVSWFI